MGDDCYRVGVAVITLVVLVDVCIGFIVIESIYAVCVAEFVMDLVRDTV